MNREDIIKLAREANIKQAIETPHLAVEELERFAGLVRAAEREACAKVCDERERANLYGVKECAAAIRARGEQ